MPHPPRRIVSLVPSLTELLADLGLDDEVVGVTRFCVRPEGWKERKTIVGGTKNVNVERVRTLAPDLILANREENTRADVEALKETAPVFVTDVAHVPGALEMIRAVGALTERAAESDALVRQIEEGFDALPAYAPLRAAYLIWREPYMTVGGDTFIHDVMRRAGLENAFGAARRYPAVEAAELARADLDVLLLSTEPYPFREAHAAELEGALPGTRVLLVDGEIFSWYGSRMRYAPPYLSALRQRLDGEAVPAAPVPASDPHGP